MIFQFQNLLCTVMNLIGRDKGVSVMKTKTSTILLTITSIIGVIGTAILASRATLKVHEQMKENDISDKKEKIKLIAKEYAPAAVTGVATIASSIASECMNIKSIGSLSAGYAVLSKTYKKHEDQIKKIFGTDGQKKILEGVTKESAKERQIRKAAEEGKVLYYEEHLDDFFEIEPERVIEAEYGINRLMAQQGYASLNNLFELLDLPPTDLGDEIGWSYGVGADYQGYSWIDFEHHTFELEDGLEAIQICYPYPPQPGFME